MSAGAVRRGSLRLISADEARRRLAEAAPAIAKKQTVPLDGAVGRVLAEASLATEDLPAFARSMMDGYAVRSADVARASTAAPVRLRIAGAILAGETPSLALAPGEAVAIPTGGALPAGADAVVPIETVALEETGVSVAAPIAAARNVVQTGEDFARGTTVFPAGHRLRATDIAALAAFGITELDVLARPRVAVLSTGREICPPDRKPTGSVVRDVNQLALAALAQACGCEVVPAGIVDDDPDALEAALRDLLDCDLVIVSGGSSIGGRDHTGEAFARLAPAGLLFHGIAVRPGRPTLTARADRALLVGLPGVPAAALVIFHVFIRPLLHQLGGQRQPLSVFQARLTEPYVSVADREDYLRVRCEPSGRAALLPAGAALSSLVAADGLAIVPAEVVALAAGDSVTILPLG